MGVGSEIVPSSLNELKKISKPPILFDELEEK